jgi:hypothetical protein
MIHNKPSIEVINSSLKILKLLDKAVIFLILWVQFQTCEQLPCRDAAIYAYPLRVYKSFAKVTDSLDLWFQNRNMMKIFVFVEFFKLEVHRLRFCHIRSNRQVLLILLSYEVLKFLLHLNLRQPFLQTVWLLFDKSRQVIWNLLICIKIECILWLVEALSELLE